MKNQTLQTLLEQYREGTLGPEGRALLEQLTRRDEVMQAASRRARQVVHRRRMGAGLAMVALLAGGATLLLPALGPAGAEPPLVAAAEPPAPASESLLAVEAPAPSRPQAEVAQAPVPAPPVERPARRAPRAEAVHEAPVVMCNNQCEADSVISEIWKFLSV